MANPICPVCEGEGATIAMVCGPRCELRSVICSLCQGAGWITPTRSVWHSTGLMLRRARADRGLTLRTASAMVRMSPTDFSRCEQGLADPSDVLDRLVEVSP